MLQDAAQRRIKTSYRKDAGGNSYMPRQFNRVTRERFFRDRRQVYFRRIEGTPSAAQLAMVQAMTRLEWFALAAERGDSLVAIREGRENRRLLLRVIADFEKSLMPGRVALSSDHLGNIHQRFGPPR
jgi:hypothetical protein